MKKATRTRLLNQWSVSKLRCLLNCPRMFDFQYIRHLKVPQSPWKLTGILVHQMFEDLFKRNFSSRETFISAGRGLWAGVVTGEHGPSSFSPKVSSPVEVAWGTMDPGVFYGMIAGALGRFWDFNEEYEVIAPPLLEKNFSIKIIGKTIRGIVDRVQPVEGGYEIWDYKPSVPSDFSLATDLQLTLYSLWGIKHFGEDPVRLGIYSYKAKKDPLTWVAPRKSEDFDAVLELFDEVGEYVFGVLNGYMRTSDVLAHFPMRDVQERTMTPRGVIGGPGCGFCEYKTACLQVERGELSSTMEYLKSDDKPTTLPLFPTPSVRKVQKEDLHAKIDRWREQPTGSEVVENQLLEMPPKPKRTSTSSKPTQYGRCSNCGYALGKNGKCGNCGAWYDTDGNFLFEKTWKKRKK